MPEKISILKESGETLNSNVVSVFMIPDTQKKYLISTENTVDPHGLTVLHVSEIVDGILQKVATDEEWSSIKTIMRAIISGNVGSYQYLQTIDSIKSVEQYSRDISVSASAAKQMSDNYAARDVSNIPSALDTVAKEEAPVAEEVVEEVAPGIGIVENSTPVAESVQVASASVPEPEPKTASEVSAPVQEEPVPSSINVEPVVVPSSVETEKKEVVNNPVVETSQPSVSTQSESVIPIEKPVVEESEVKDEKNIPSVDDVVNKLNNTADEQQSNDDSSPVVVEPHLVAASPITLPVTDVAVKSAPEPVTFVAQADLYSAQPAVVVPTGQATQDNVFVPSSGVRFDVKPSFSPDASLDEVVLASQEMFIEGTRNLVQTIQEKVYRDLYHKEAELKAKEEMLNQREEALNQREKTLNEQMMTMMSNFVSMQGKVASSPQPTKVEADNDKK